MELGSHQELERRLAVIGPEDALRGLFFRSALAQVRALKDPEAWRRCVEAAGGERFMAFFSYPMSAFLRLLYTAADSLGGPQGSASLALGALGRELVPHYLESSAGSVLLLLAGREPRRLVEALPSAYHTAVRHGECLVDWLGPTHGRILFQGCTLPAEFYAGAVRGVFDYTRLARATVFARQVSLLDVEVEVSWEPMSGQERGQEPMTESGERAV